MLLKDKVCLVTGAASGIGRAIALAYGRERAKVVVSDVNVAGGEETVELLRAMSDTNAVFVPADVSVASDCERLVARCVEVFGRLDVACNNAGIGGDLAPTADYPLDAWQRVIGVNLSGVFHCMKYELPELLKTGGSIVNVASILGSVGFANAPAYTAAKHGVVGLTKTAALEYSPRGVRINAVGPAFIHTPMIAGLEEDPATQALLVSRHPIGRIGDASEVAELVLWLNSSRASFCTGAYFPVDGGYLSL
ncbi:SDR family oxidoreductase [Piscinibacter sp. HJYY11]|uniref:SDR family oxidoreductase n=1 Tax=Piscinibacter sp. HJYY11 TaxID=2801333 RepID=UPI00191F6144|nr:SDR family oxidoreductase [Piscinibacter sp. HJYY11]MBL0726577.1 SDR family oxidoreductase [Piscinibacter sp. HJYY11]